MGATHDSELLQETFDIIKNKSRDQDVIYFFRGLSDNIKMRRQLVAYLKDEYSTVSKLISLMVKMLSDGSAHQTFGQ
jgi:aminopeptidase 2